MDREGIGSMHLPADRVADFRDWQTKLILETGEVLHEDEWRGQLLALSSEPPEKAVAIAILAVAEDGDSGKVRGLLEQLPLLVAGTVTDRVYGWLNGRLVRELIDSELPAPTTPSPSSRRFRKSIVSNERRHTSTSSLMNGWTLTGPPKSMS